MVKVKVKVKAKIKVKVLAVEARQVNLVEAMAGLPADREGPAVGSAQGKQAIYTLHIIYPGRPPPQTPVHVLVLVQSRSSVCDEKK